MSYKKLMNFLFLQSQEDLLQNSNSDSSNSKLSSQSITKQNTPLDTSLVVGNHGIDDVDTGYHGTNTGYRSIANVPTTFRESQII